MRIIPSPLGILRMSLWMTLLLTATAAATGTDQRPEFLVRRPRYRGDFLLGLRAGYVWLSAEAARRVEGGGPVVGGPDVRVAGPTPCLILGWQGLRMRRSEASQP